MVLSRNYLDHFLQASAFTDTIVELYGEMELQQLLDQFFARAIYYGVVGYEQVREADRCDSGVAADRRKKSSADPCKDLEFLERYSVASHRKRVRLQGALKRFVQRSGTLVLRLGAGPSQNFFWADTANRHAP